MASRDSNIFDDIWVVVLDNFPLRFDLFEKLCNQSDTRHHACKAFALQAGDRVRSNNMRMQKLVVKKKKYI